MNFKSFNFQLWLNQNRLWLWWVVYIPLVSGILFFNIKHLVLSGDELGNFILSPQYKMLNSPLIIILGRIVTVAIEAVVLMVCLLFPYFNISKGGVQWSKEFQEEITEASGEITGEEIESLVQEESLRWSFILQWLKSEKKELQETSLILREFLATFWEAFPAQKISLTLLNEKGKWGLSHPLLPRLLIVDHPNAIQLENTVGMKLHLGINNYLVFRMFSESEGYSDIDEQFILVLGEIFVKIMMNQDYTIDELLTYFERVPLLFSTLEV